MGFFVRAGKWTTLYDDFYIKLPKQSKVKKQTISQFTRESGH